MNEIDKITNNLEFLFLKRIVSGLRDGEIDEVQAKEYAQTFMAFEPFVSVEDAKSKMAVFINTHGYFHELDEYINAYYDEKRIETVIEKMRKYLKNNEIDMALQIAKNA